MADQILLRPILLFRSMLPLKIRMLGNVRQIIYGVQLTMHYLSPSSTSILIIGLLLRNATILLV